MPGPSSITSIVAPPSSTRAFTWIGASCGENFAALSTSWRTTSMIHFRSSADLLVRQIQLERMLPDVGGGDALTDRRREPLRPDVVGDRGRVDLQRRGRLRHRGEQSPGFLLDEPQELASLVVVQRS